MILLTIKNNEIKELSDKIARYAEQLITEKLAERMDSQRNKRMSMKILTMGKEIQSTKP